MSSILTAENLVKTFHTDGNEVRVIQNLELDIREGEFAVIMGSSGSGKSSLLYLLSGLDRPCEGSVRLGDTCLDKLDENELARLRRSGIGFVFQDFNLVPHLSLLENILIAGYLFQKNKAMLERRARELLELVEIGHLADRLPTRVSGGEQQRCAVARALINQPRVLLADEPTGNLNSPASENVFDLLNGIHRRGQTIVLVTHELKAACRGDRVLFMRDGRIVDGYAFDPTVAPIDREIALFQWLSERGW